MANTNTQNITPKTAGPRTTSAQAMEPQAIDTQAIDTQTAAQQPLTTPRLLLRRWQQSDLVPFARLNADPEVMRYFPYRLGRPASDAFVEHIEACFEQQGFGLWAVELREGGDFIGFVGLKQPNFDAHFMPSVEVGWRLARPYWGHGYATEGAQRALTYGFDTAGVDEIVSFTAVVNQRSKAVMARLGMTYCATDDFDHPALPKGHELQRHVLYRMSKSRWQMLQADG